MAVLLVSAISAADIFAGGVADATQHEDAPAGLMGADIARCAEGRREEHEAT